MKGQTANCYYCGNEFVKKTKVNRFCDATCQAKLIHDRSKKNRFKIFNRDDFKCFYCNTPSLESDARLVIDHVIAQSVNGCTNRWDNLVTCCTSCNMNKSNFQFDTAMLSRIKSEIIRRNEIHGLID